LNILLVNESDRGGGAEKIASALLRSYRRLGHESWMAVAKKQTDDDRVVVIEQDRYRNAWARFCLRWARPLEHPQGAFPSLSFRRGVRFLRETVSEPSRVLGRFLGHEDFDSPATGHLPDLFPATVDLLHVHNLHGRYFDLRSLPDLSHRLPLVLTLHDAWLLSGHCSHSFNCERWKTGCGQCPDLTIYPALWRDGTAFNWERKRRIFAASRLYVVAPSRWLMSKVEESIVAPAIREACVIPNGINLDTFKPQAQRGAREKLGLPLDVKIVLFVANRIRRNPFKDFPTLLSALQKVGQSCQGDKVCMLAVGESGKPEKIAGVDFRFVQFQSDELRMAKYYQAADLYVHAARADTFPNTILEASACGLPVVASGVGGIVEQVDEGKTGFLVPPLDSGAMAARIVQLIRDDSLRSSMGRLGAELVYKRFGAERMAAEYIKWFEEIRLAHAKDCGRQPAAKAERK
jgi:glycosyltransferase involved in cell wall biosynthesis